MLQICGLWVLFDSHEGANSHWTGFVDTRGKFNASRNRRTIYTRVFERRLITDCAATCLILVPVEIFFVMGSYHSKRLNDDIWLAFGLNLFMNSFSR